jgi:hypothetical protein
MVEISHAYHIAAALNIVSAIAILILLLAKAWLRAAKDFRDILK